MGTLEPLGPYELRGELGRGGMAVVWRAYDPKLEREVAIKEQVFAPSLDPAVREQLTARFVREGKTVAGFNHPGIVTVFASDVYDGRPALVMELVEGSTLTDALARGALGEGAAVSVADQLLDALSYAHVRGVVHRDVKPDNIFVTAEGRVKIADFGIARIADKTQFTQEGTVMGTPGYMAPEQVRGLAADARADIFAVGAILYEMLTGENPFGANEDIESTAIMYRIVHENPPAIQAGVADPLRATALIALNKDPDARFQSADEMRRALLGEVAVAMPKAATAVRGTSTAQIIIIGVAVIALLGVGGLVWSSGRASVGSATGGVSAPGAVTQQAEAVTAEELLGVCDEYDAMVSQAAGVFYEQEIGEGEYAVFIPMSIYGNVSVPSGPVKKQMAIAEKGLTSIDPNVSAGAAHLMAVGEALISYEQSVSNSPDGRSAYDLARVRYLAWAARGHLTGDQVVIDSVENLRGAASQLPEPLEVWFVLLPDSGRAIVELDSGPMDTSGYSMTWEYDDFETYSGGVSSRSDVEGWLVSDEYAMSDGGPWMTAGGCHVFGMVGNRMGLWTWTDPTASGPDGRPQNDPAALYALSGSNSADDIKRALDEGIAVFVPVATGQ